MTEELTKGYAFTKAQIAELESLRAENAMLKSSGIDKVVKIIAETEVWKECETLRSRLAEIEAQEPVAYRYQFEGVFGPVWLNHMPSNRYKIISTQSLFSAPVVSPDVAALKEEIAELKSHNKQIMDMYVQYSDKNQLLKTELEAARRVVALYERLDSPIGNILTSEQRKFLFGNEYELKYLPLYADQPDPTHIVKWVFEVRDKQGASVAGAHEWLYQTIENAQVAANDQKGGMK